MQDRTSYFIISLLSISDQEDEMSKIIDISVTITNEIPVWPGDPSVELERVSKIEDGANANVSQVRMSVHTGTHMDAPYHFIKDGYTIEAVPLETLIGPAQVVKIADAVEVIDAQVIRSAGIRPDTVRVLFRTRNSQFWPSQTSDFRTDFVGIDAGGAQALVDMGIRLVGIDYLSIAPFHMSRPTHEALLGRQVAVLEGCNLSQVEPGTYMLYALPTKLGGSDGAPVRAVLIAE
jgi:arylformamidase